MSQLNLNHIFKNRILSTLKTEDLELMLPHLQPVTLKQHDVICEVGEIFKYIYFMEEGVASVLKRMEDGSSVEVGMVGFEGITPIAALLGDKISDQHIVIQLPGHAFKIDVASCKIAFEKNERFRRSVLNFINAFLNFGAQTAACNRLHSVEKRLIRWLLVSSDRFQSNVLPLTQEYLAAMLGVRRVGVTESAGGLQRSGLIHYTRGNITILDRPELEQIACECYGTDREQFSQLLSLNYTIVR